MRKHPELEGRHKQPLYDVIFGQSQMEQIEKLREHSYGKIPPAGAMCEDLLTKSKRTNGRM
jgi:hypothetical protein